MGPHEILSKLESGEFSLVEKDSRSKVWLIFARIKNPNGELIPDYTYCKSCLKLFKYSKKATSNMVKHRCYIDFVKGQDDSVQEEEENSTLDNEEKLTDNHNRSNNLAKLLTRWIIKEYQPYDLIQSEGLKAIFQEIAMLGSKFGGDVDIVKLLPSMSDLIENINDIYKPCFEQVKAEIALNKEHGFGLTCDIRNDNLTKQNYILLTAHYMNNDISTTRFLGLRKLEDEKNTKQHILQKIVEILSEFDCELSSRFLFVADTNNEYFKNIPNTQILPCMSQLLSNALFRCMEEIPEIMELITSCSNLVNFLNKNGKENVLGGFLKNNQHNPWLATFNMIRTIKNNWSNIEILLQKMKEKDRILTLRVSHLTAVINTLQPFEEALETLEDDNAPTLHLVIVYLHELKKACDRDDNEFHYFEFIEKLKQKLRKNLEKIEMNNVTILHRVALFLYPLTKKLLQFSDTEKQLIEDECKRLMQNYKSEVKPMVKQEPESATGTPVAKRQKLLSDFLESEEQDPNVLFNHEIQFYKSARVVNNSEFCVFNWWQMQKDNFPVLSKLCWTILATPATCAASQRIFSAGSKLLAGRSVQFSKEADLEKILFINSNGKQDQV